jgi:hypothetical protein
MHGDLVFVVERDNHRVQVFELPDFRPLGHFGTDELVKPYGLWVEGRAAGTVFVTDNHDLGPERGLDQRLHRFRVGSGRRADHGPPRRFLRRHLGTGHAGRGGVRLR